MTSHHSCQPQATAGKLSRCQPNRLDGASCSNVSPCHKITLEDSHNSPGRETGGTIMCCLRHPQYRSNDRRIQPRPNHSVDGNSEGETEGTSPSSKTPRDEITPTYGATKNSANPNTCGIISTDSNEKTKGPGHTGTYVPHSRDRQPAETALSQGEHQGPHPTTVQRITDLLRKS